MAEQPLSPRQLYEEATANTNDYSKKACLQSLAARKVILSGRTTALNPEIPSTIRTHEPDRGFLSRLLSPFSTRTTTQSAQANEASDTTAAATGNEAAVSYAVASVTHAEPGKWEGQKAHFIRLHVEFHPDSEHYLERVDFTIRVWKAGDALKSIEPIADKQLLTFEPPHAPEFGNNAPPIVLYSPRAVIGRPAGSTVEPFWEGHFHGEQFVYFAEAMPPINYMSAGPKFSTQPKSLLHIAAFGNKRRQAAPHFDVGFVVLSQGQPFDLTAYSTSLHWGLPVPAVGRYLFTPYKPAKFTRNTRVIPKGEKRLGMDFSKVGLRDKLKDMMGWAAPYDTVSCLTPSRLHSTLLTLQIWFGCPSGCVDKPTTPGRNCSSDYCRTCEESRRLYNEQLDAEEMAVST